jgi:hypothetical protein
MITRPWKKIALAAMAIVLIAVIFYFKAGSERQIRPPLLIRHSPNISHLIRPVLFLPTPT